MVPTGSPVHTTQPLARPTRSLLVDALTIASGCLATAVAAWLAPASIHITAWGSSGGVARVALFAPAFYLKWLLGAAVLGAAALVAPASQSPQRRTMLGAETAPLSAFWIWIVPFLPWLPDRLPLLLVLAGPVRWLIAAAAIAAVVVRAAKASAVQWPGLPVPGRKTAFAIALLVYLWSGYRSVHQVGFGGDEPHYLVLTQSLLLDHDIQIENNHARGDYRRYFGGDLRPDYLTRGLNGQIYSIHAPGLPAVLLPAFAVAGAWGAVMMLCLFGALAALAVFDVAVLVGGVRAAWPTWASVCLTVPFVPHAWAIFPEMAGAAVVSWALLWSMRGRPASPLAWFWRGACLALLPWLHTKFAVFLAVLTLALLVRARTRLANLIALALPIAVSLAGWAAFFYTIYGTVDPQAPYGDYTAQFVRFENVPRSLLGALFDQKFGLFVYAPVFIASIWGTVLLLRDRQWRWIAVLSAGLACLFTLSSARLYMWWGGASAPARFLVPVVPLLAPALAAVFARVRGGVVAAHVWAAFVASLLVSVLSLADLGHPMLFSSPHGVARLAELFRGGSPLPTALPTFTEENWLAPALRLALWFVAIGAAATLSWFAAVRSRRHAASSPPSLYWLLLSEAAIVLVVAAAVVGPYNAEARAESVRHGRYGLLEAFDPDARRPFDYSGRRFAKMTPQAWLASSSLSFRLDPDEEPDAQGRLTEALALPPGEYRLTVLFDAAVQRGGDVLAALGGGHVLARAAGPLPTLTTLPLSVPVPVPRLWVQMSDPPSAAAARRVDIVPTSIVPRAQRPDVVVRRIESVAGRPGAYMAYVNDGAFPEDGVFWTRGTSEADLLIAPAGSPVLHLTIHNGPAAGAVRIAVAGRIEQVSLGPGETRVVDMPVPPGAASVSLKVQAPSSFRPADNERGSTDTRDLGCQVRVEVANAGA